MSCRKPKRKYVYEDVEVRRNIVGVMKAVTRL
jgi:hypothetical protein